MWIVKWEEPGYRPLVTFHDFWQLVPNLEFDTSHQGTISGWKTINVRPGGLFRVVGVVGGEPRPRQRNETTVNWYRITQFALYIMPSWLHALDNVSFLLDPLISKLRKDRLNEGIKFRSVNAVNQMKIYTVTMKVEIMRWTKDVNK